MIDHRGSNQIDVRMTKQRLEKPNVAIVGGLNSDVMHHTVNLDVYVSIALRTRGWMRLHSSWLLARAPVSAAMVPAMVPAATMLEVVRDVAKRMIGKRFIWLSRCPFGMNESV